MEVEPLAVEEWGEEYAAVAVVAALVEVVAPSAFRMVGSERAAGPQSLEATRTSASSQPLGLLELV